MTLFLVFGAIAVGAAIGMVLQRNAIHAALLLVVNLISVAVLFLSLSAEFLFVSQIIVYAGAIVILFLFVIMLLGVDRDEVLNEPRRMQTTQLLLGGLVAIGLIVGMSSALSSGRLSEPIPNAAPGFGSADAIGNVLFRSYLVPFEVTGLLLLVATIGILMLAKRRPR